MPFLAIASRWFLGGGWKVIAVVGGVAVIFASGWIARGKHEDSRRLAEIQRGMGKANKASTGLEKDRGKREVVYRYITKQVDKIIDRPVYRLDCFDADGLRLANDALAGKLDGRVPGPTDPQ